MANTDELLKQLTQLAFTTNQRLELLEEAFRQHQGPSATTASNGPDNVEFLMETLAKAPIVVVKKSNGKLRICADYSTGLNDALEPNKHPLPVPDDIFANLAGNCIFSVIDLSEAYFQIEVDEDSGKLLTINTHRGLYKFNRFPLGVKQAPGEFQKIIDAMISGLKNTSAYLDDIMVAIKSVSEHKKQLNELFGRLQDYGFVVRPEKCQLFLPKIEFLGHIIDGNGLHPNSKKIQAIKEMPPPKNISELRSVLGAINYYGKFVPRLQKIRQPLDNLLRKDVE
ncbi:uncharacterized protein K02A2.6-like [Uloborus diversus]|uniref:uncharacterized protein K02A2.6-like n=1 Tax=Uloborus diversus TaxID=327109 RepID=UPI00240984A7|nr:uncharacterized protein K02A2.6-like [Uloborus diversus]